MRIISGKYKGHRIQAPSPQTTRPTTDRVRETLFNILNNIIDFEGIKVLDIYSGSGSLGLEFLSRGASIVHFIEKNYSAYNILLGNINKIGVQEQVRIFKVDAIKYVQTTAEKYDIVIADPPFFKFDIYDVVKGVFEKDLLNDDGMMIIERSIQTAEKDKENFLKEPYKRIGDTLLYFFNKNDMVKNENDN
ncbi:MAG TPA: 16S rRNA (guanine(966)-N(2))-methyltransferase RsmD [Ignavibacteriales bacterium]|nr:16S rRNA (guanine(966)-N(2))-methyltransferase RsmD [Ignavibacteriales bacterium]